MGFKMMSDSDIEQKGTGSYTEHHSSESVCNDPWLALVWIVHPQKSEKFLVLGWYRDNKERLFNVSCDSNSVYSKTTQDVKNLLVKYEILVQG